MSMRAYVEWVVETVLPFWQDRALDTRTGLFYEKLNFDGTPDRKADIRTRTHMRQVYVFAHSAVLGALPRDHALAVATEAADTLHAKAWSPDRRPGWVHRLSPAGIVTDGKRDLYDHAFVLHGLAWLAKATGEKRYFTWIDQTLSAIDAVMAAPGGGWAESDAHELPRRQNPHMHMLEACLALHETTGEARHLARAAEVVSLFRSRFFDESIRTLREFFDAGWQLNDALGADRLEPGHMMEWVWLLRRYERVSRQPVQRLTTALFSSAERIGMDKASFLLDEVDPAGTPTSDGRRLWPQTEYLKACLVEAEMQGNAAYRVMCDAMAARIMAHYAQSELRGLWIDRFDLTGKVAVDHVPASIVYHLLAPVVEYLRIEAKS